MTQTSEVLSGRRVAFQGELGAFSEIAARRLGDPVPARSFTDVFVAVTTGKTEAGVVPLENSLGGTIYENYDLLLKYPVRIVAETYVRVEHCLLGLPGATIESARQVLSHPQALAQCDQFLAGHPHLEVVVAYDTAGSAKLIRDENTPDRLAIASDRAAAHYGLNILARNIASRAHNITRFAFIERAATPADTAAGETPRKTTVVFTLPHKTGSLFHALSVFALRDINLTKIESRPYREQAFEYLFFAEFQEPSDPLTGERALAHLGEIAPFLQHLGTYPCINPAE